MPKKRKEANLSRRTVNSTAVRDRRARRSGEQIEKDNENNNWPTTPTSSSGSFLRLAFQYEPDVEYYAHSKVIIGTLEVECLYCHTLKFKNKPVGICFSSGKVQPPEIDTLPTPLQHHLHQLEHKVKPLPKP